MGSWIQRLGWLVRVVDLLSQYWTAILSIGGAGVVGALAYATEVFNAYAPFSWIAIGVLTFFLLSIALRALAQARLLFHYIRIKRRSTEVDAVNPLEYTFQRRRINVTQLLPPVGNQINSRTFVDCDIVGPSNILVVDCVFQGVGGSAVDAVLYTTDNFPKNCTVFRNCTFRDCRFFSLTFIVPISIIGQFAQHNFTGLNWLSHLPEPQATEAQP